MTGFTGKRHRVATVDLPRTTVDEDTPIGNKNQANGRRIRYKRLNTGRRVLLEQVRLVMVLAITGCLLLAIETTPPGVIHLPGLEAAAPSLGLLFCMAVGFLYREEEGALAGLCAGWLMDAASGSGIMLSPLLGCLCGYMAGWVGQRRLAHNLPSFVVFAVLGGGVEAVFSILRETVICGALPPLSWSLRGLIPVWVLTVLASPVVYGVMWLERYIMNCHDSKIH